MAEETKSNEFSVDGIVAQRNKQPYIQFAKNGKLIGQFSMAEARNVAHDILIMCSRVEADAMLLKFFEKNQFPSEAAGALLVDFRDFRLSLDSEEVEKTVSEPIVEVKAAYFNEILSFLADQGLELTPETLDHLKVQFLANQKVNP